MENNVLIVNLIAFLVVKIAILDGSIPRNIFLQYIGNKLNKILRGGLCVTSELIVMLVYKR